MIVAYCRQSSKEQAMNTNALHQQIDRCKKAGADKVYYDIASGKKKDRKGFVQLLKDTEKDKITEVICTRIDRLGRSVLSIQECLDLFVKHRIKLTVLDGDCNIDTASGRGVIAIQAAVAQMEAELIAERIKNGKAYARQQGYAFQPPFGYTVVDRQYQLHPENSQIARKIIEKFFEIRSINGVAKWVKRFKPQRKKGGSLEKSPPYSPSGLRDWLLHPVLRGYTRYKTPKLIVVPTHLDRVLISNPEWEEIQRILAYNKTHHGYRRSPKPQYPLSGLLRCVCGASLYARKYGRYYQCYHQLCHRREFVKADFVEKELIEALVNRAGELVEAMEKHDQQLEDNPQLKELRQQLIGLEQLGANLAIDAAKESIKSQIAIIEEGLKTKDYSEESLKQFMVFRDRNYWQSLTTEDKMTIYRGLVEKMVIDKLEVIDIVFKF